MLTAIAAYKVILNYKEFLELILLGKIVSSFLRPESPEFTHLLRILAVTLITNHSMNWFLPILLLKKINIDGKLDKIGEQSST